MQQIVAPAFVPSTVFPVTVGQLPNGLKSPVIELENLRPLITKLHSKFSELVSLVESNREVYSCVSREVGVFVFKKDEKYLLGQGSEARVYLGGFMEDYPDRHPESIRRSFRNLAKPVAVKIYASNRDSAKEIMNFKKIPRNADGIISYIDHFVENGDPCTVQELGLTTVHNFEKKSGRNMDFDEKMRVVRAACLAMKELHCFSKGIIIHRDFRAPNVIVTESGTLKVCDFGITRVVEENDVHFAFS